MSARRNHLRVLQSLDGSLQSIYTSGPAAIATTTGPCMQQHAASAKSAVGTERNTLLQHVCPPQPSSRFAVARRQFTIDLHKWPGCYCYHNRSLHATTRCECEIRCRHREEHAAAACLPAATIFAFCSRSTAVYNRPTQVARLLLLPHQVLACNN